MRKQWVRAAAGVALVAIASVAAAQDAPVRLTALTAEAPQNKVDAAAQIRRGIAEWEQGDPAAAVRLWQPHAERGDAEAQFNLAQAFRLGRGVTADPAQAEALYRRAAAQGHPAASGSYAVMLYKQGRHAEAMPLLLRSAEAGEARARYLVGLAHFNGDLLPQDWPRAYALLVLAARTGLAPAKSALLRVDGYLAPEQKDEGRALARFMESVAGFAQQTEAVATSVSAESTEQQRPALQPVALLAPAAAPVPLRSSTMPAATNGTASLQLGAYGKADNATRMRDRLRQEQLLQGYSITLRQAGRLTLVMTQGFADVATARTVCRDLRTKGVDCLAAR